MAHILHCLLSWNPVRPGGHGLETLVFVLVERHEPRPKRIARQEPQLCERGQWLRLSRRY